MKINTKIILGYTLATLIMLMNSISLAKASERSDLANLAKSCEASSNYSECVASKYFNSLD